MIARGARVHLVASPADRKRAADAKREHAGRRLERAGERGRVGQHDVGRIAALRKRHDADRELLGLGERHPPQRRLLARRVGVEGQKDRRAHALQLGHLAVGKGRPHRRHRVRRAGLVQGEDVGVALDHDGMPGRGDRAAGAVEPVEHLVLVEEPALRRVQVLRGLAARHLAGAEPPHSPADVGQREHQAAAEPVDRPAAATPESPAWPSSAAVKPFASAAAHTRSQADGEKPSR